MANFQTGISVIIPTYNRARQVPDAINSAFSQTLQPREILVCDDGSTDDTRRVVAALAEDNPCVKWIPGNHAGLPAVPRNSGIRFASGEWIAFLDSDDIWMPQKLEKQMMLLKEKSSSFCCTNAYMVSGMCESPYFSVENTKERLLTFRDLLFRNPVINSSVIVHRDALLASGGFPEDQSLKAMEDYALWLRILSMSQGLYFSEPLVRYADTIDSVRSHVAGDDVLRRVGVLENFISWAAGEADLLRERRAAQGAIIRLMAGYWKSKLGKGLKRLIR